MKILLSIVFAIGIVLSAVFAQEICEWQVAPYNRTAKFSWAAGGCMIGLNDGSFVLLENYRGIAQ